MTSKTIFTDAADEQTVAGLEPNNQFSAFYDRSTDFLREAFFLEYGGGLPDDFMFDFARGFKDEQTYLFSMCSGTFNGNEDEYDSKSPLQKGTFNAEGHERISGFIGDLNEIIEDRFITGVRTILEPDHCSLLISSPTEFMRLIKHFLKFGSTKSIDDYINIPLTKGKETIDSGISKYLHRAEKALGEDLSYVGAENTDLNVLPSRPYLSAEHAFLAALTVSDIGMRKDYIVPDSLRNLEMILRQCQGLHISRENALLRLH